MAAALACATLSGCGLNVQSPDLFLLTRTGQGTRLTLLVNDSGTVRCNGRAPIRLPDPLLIQARALATDLDADAKAKLRIAAAANSVYLFTVSLQNGTISFPDSAGSMHPELARTELFALHVAAGPCLARR